MGEVAVAIGIGLLLTFELSSFVMRRFVFGERPLLEVVSREVVLLNIVLWEVVLRVVVSQEVILRKTLPSFLTPFAFRFASIFLSRHLKWLLNYGCRRLQCLVLIFVRILCGGGHDIHNLLARHFSRQSVTFLTFCWHCIFEVVPGKLISI